MSFNALTLQSVTAELNKRIIGARVDKIHQPETNTITIELRLPGENLSLLLCTQPSLARMHLTENKFTNPKTPSSFCMLLRKHLDKYRLDKISNIPFERIVRFDFSREEDFGRSREKKSLILEIMGRHSNLILLDDKDTIIDALDRIDESKSRVRQVLPKLTYTLPPAQKKENPKTLSLAKFSWFIEVADPNNLSDALFKNIAGISPYLAKQIISSVVEPKNNPEIVYNRLMDLIALSEQGELVPYIKEEKLYFYPSQKGSINQVLDAYYTKAFYKDKLNQQKQNLLSLLSTHIEKAEKKLALRTGALEKALDADIYRKKGDLLTSSLYLLEKGATEALVPDYYTEGEPLVTIELDPRLTPSQNAQSYYKRYNKARSALRNLDTLLEDTKNELHYLQETKGLIEAAKDLEDLESLNDELIKEGYIKTKKLRQTNRKKDTTSASQPRRYRTPSGSEIVVGRNNRQNDMIRRQGSGDFWWFHTQKLPGAHVVLKTSSPDEKDLQLAAGLAAYFSKGSEDSLVEVDSARLKYVRKPTGAKPGFVLYDNERTYMVKPNRAIFSELKQLN